MVYNKLHIQWTILSKKRRIKLNQVIYLSKVEHKLLNIKWKKNLVHYVENGPFGSQAPEEDTSFNNIPKEDINILRELQGL